jgi:Fe2+ transport system protein FeoA
LLSMKMPLSDMDIGRSGVIISISGGKKTVAKLESLGIRAGALIVKKNALPAKGPLIVRVANSEVAIGYALAKKIWVEAKG